MATNDDEGQRSTTGVLARLAAIEAHAEAVNGEVRDLRAAMTESDLQVELTRAELADITETTRGALADVTEATRGALADATEEARAGLALKAAVEKRNLDRLMSDKLFRTRWRAAAFGGAFAAAGFATCLLLGL